MTPAFSFRENIDATGFLSRQENFILARSRHPALKTMNVLCAGDVAAGRTGS
jgi:hypothetical protein